MNDIDYAETDQEEELEKYKKRFVIKHWIVTILLLVVVACFSSEITQIYGLIIDKKSADSDAMKNINVISENLKNFRKVIDAYYLGDIDEKKILDQTLKGYVKGLDDEYTEYMTTEEWQEFDEKAFGNFVGIGVVMSIDENENIVIISVVEGSPAESCLALRALDLNPI